MYGKRPALNGARAMRNSPMLLKAYRRWTHVEGFLSIVTRRQRLLGGRWMGEVSIYITPSVKAYLSKSIAWSRMKVNLLSA